MPSVKEINTIVARFCAEAINEPLSFFSEADLQARLSFLLREQYPDRYCTKVKRGPKRKSKSTKTYKTGLVHSEYGAEKGRRMDIVVFSEEQVKSIDDYRLRKDGRYLMPPFGFELGTESITDVGEHLESDVAKLGDRVSERGYVIHFYRDTAFADTGTKSRIATEESIRQRFRYHVEQCSHEPKIVILAFVLRIAHLDKDIKGKCEMYFPDEPHWPRKNLRDIEKEIRDFLNRQPPTALIQQELPEN